MNIDLLMITTSHPLKQECLRGTIPSLLDKFNFSNKLIGIDVVSLDHEINSKTLNLLKNLNFVVDLHRGLGMVQNLGSILECSNSDWILYCEDDIFLKDFPNFDLLLKFLIDKYNEDIGIIDLYYGPGVGTCDYKHDEFKKNFINSQYHFEFEGYQIFERTKESYDCYFINFPILLIKKKIFYNCFNFCLTQCKGLQIEYAFSRAFYLLGYHNIFKKIHIFDKNKFDIESCLHLTSYEIARNILFNNLLVETRETNPDKPNLTISAFRVNQWESKAYTF